MTAGALLLHAVAGYLFLTTFEYTRYRIRDDSGYHVLLQSAIAGVVLLLIAHAASWGIESRCPTLISSWKFWAPDLLTVEVVLSLLLAWALPPLLTFIGIGNNASQIAENLASEAGGHIELLIMESGRRKMPVEITLRSRKVYVGYPVTVAVGKTRGGDLTISPMFSGYRDEDKLVVKFTLDYTSVVEAYTADGTGLTTDDFRVAIPLMEVVSARLFDKDVYEAFRAGPEPNVIDHEPNEAPD